MLLITNTLYLPIKLTALEQNSCAKWQLQYLVNGAISVHRGQSSWLDLHQLALCFLGAQHLEYVSLRWLALVCTPLGLSVCLAGSQ